MEAKKILSLVLTIIGAVGLVIGVLGIFQGFNLANISPYAWTILGVIFFIAGIGLMKTISGKSSSTTA